MKLNIVVVKNFTIIFSLPYLAATHALCFYRMGIFKPVYHIYIMYMLLYNMIAAKPHKIIPVAHLVLHFSLIVFSRIYPYTIIIPPCLRRCDVTDKIFLFI